MSESTINQTEVDKNIEKLARLIDGEPFYVAAVLLATALKSKGIDPFEFLKDEC